MVKQYTGEKVNVHFEPGRCVHAAECVRGLSDVFDVEKRPWIQPDNAEVTDVIKVVERCPSGALTYECKSGVLESHPETRVAYGDDGELFIYGDFKLVQDDKVVRLNRAILTSDLSKTESPPFYTKSFQEQSDKTQYYKPIQDEANKY
ncbi:(4Fe-4S)-binding protein [Staphylococcus lutrae]|uniref:Divergent 4Fe-4S mono-cluster domain-containing protein n=1 Tax=Staphylococcus lutrae TaxID=155085 RepID=A0AAC9WJ36_9STAP|nr:(4Fe-4S)-binding protein [Staphylococcus lutrae]ARJ50820.1 hypothetical protein B5P37_05545 [Staphylococcus lutrae]PNZ39780.1 hypothetical protein CD134_00660 [Staphylococcus lutrae]